MILPLTSTTVGRPAKRLPIGPSPKPSRDMRRKQREGASISHTPCSSISSWQSTSSFSTDTDSASSSRVGSPTSHATYSTLSPAQNDCIYDGSPIPRLVHVPLPGFPSHGRSRPCLTIKVPHTDIPCVRGIVETVPPHVILPSSDLSSATSSPLSPLVFAHPTPHAPLLIQQQRKKKLDKLRRTFGENVPSDLVFASSESFLSPGLPHDPMSPLYPKRAKTKGWGMLRMGTPFKQGLFRKRLGSNGSMHSSYSTPPGSSAKTGSLRTLRTRPSSSTTTTTDGGHPPLFTCGKSHCEHLALDGRPAQSRPSQRPQSWQGKWNVGDMEQVKTALRALKA